MCLLPAAHEARFPACVGLLRKRGVSAHQPAGDDEFGELGGPGLLVLFKEPERLSSLRPVYRCGSPALCWGVDSPLCVED
jgi:hypothetical protein